MILKLKDLTDQQCADVIAHFVERKNVDEIIIHTKKDDIVVTKKPRLENLDDLDDTSGFACAGACALIATM